jgi:hypothetical protein
MRPDPAVSAWSTIHARAARIPYGCREFGPLRVGLPGCLTSRRSPVRAGHRPPRSPPAQTLYRASRSRTESPTGGLGNEQGASRFGDGSVRVVVAFPGLGGRQATPIARILQAPWPSSLLAHAKGAVSKTVVGRLVHRGFESHPLRCRPGKCLDRAEFRRPGVDPSGASGGVSDRQRNRHFVAMPLPWALPRTVGCRRQDRTTAKRRNVSQRTLASLDEATARFPRGETHGSRPDQQRDLSRPWLLLT